MNNKYRKIKNTLIVLLVLLFVQGCSGKAVEYRSYSGNVSVKLGLGMESVLAEGKNLPVTVHIEGDYAAEGSWCVLSVPTNASDYYAYRKSLEQDDIQDISYVVPAESYGGQIMIEILNEQEKVIYSRICSYRMTYTDEELILWGQLGVQSDSVAWPDEVVQGEALFQVKSIVLSTDMLYEQKEAYDMLDFVTADAKYFSQLEPKLKNALLEWVEDGGCLLLEGCTAETMDEIFTDTAKAKVCIVGNAEFKLQNYAEGMIWSTEEYITHILPRMDNETQQEFIKLLSAAQTGGYSSSGQVEDNLSETPLLTKLMRQKSTSKTLNAWLYVAILAIYLAAGIPCLYITAQKSKNVRWFRPSVCLLAVIFSIIIFAVGSDTRYSSPFMKTVTVILSDTHISDSSEAVYAGIQAPFNSSYEVSINPEYEVNALMQTDDWENSLTLTGNKKTAVLSEYEDQTLISFSNLTAFSTRYFKFSRDIPDVGGVTGTVTENANGLQGELTNQTQYELVSALVCLGSHVALIEHWQAMETISLEEEQKNARVHMMTLEQFCEGSYQNRGQWIGRLSEYYEYFLSIQDDRARVMAEIEYESALQEYTQYPVENESMIILTVSEE